MNLPATTGGAAATYEVNHHERESATRVRILTNHLNRWDLANNRDPGDVEERKLFATMLSMELRDIPTSWLEPLFEIAKREGRSFIGAADIRKAQKGEAWQAFRVNQRIALDSMERQRQESPALLPCNQVMSPAEAASMRRTADWERWGEPAPDRWFVRENGRSVSEWEARPLLEGEEAAYLDTLLGCPAWVAKKCLQDGRTPYGPAEELLRRHGHLGRAVQELSRMQPHEILNRRDRAA